MAGATASRPCNCLATAKRIPAMKTYKRKRYLVAVAILLLLFALFRSIVAELSAYPTQGQIIADHALEHLNARYVFHTSGPDRFDCSGLVRHIFTDEGIDIPHCAEEIGALDAYPLITDLSQLEIGDVLCFDTVADSDPSDHVGIYLGNNTFVHASSTYKDVRISAIEGLYLENFSGARRIADTHIGLFDRLQYYIHHISPETFHCSFQS